jgi:serine/threonine-protein kinase
MSRATSELDDLADAALEAHVSPAHRVGSIVGGTYRLVRHLASGGTSHVFEGEHVRVGRTFAVKVLRPELATGRVTAQRFRREARAIAHLQSEHVVGVVDCGELDDRTPYLVMDLLRGEDLRSLLNREGKLPLRRALPLLIQACRGVSVVHAAGLIHRDLKPENLFVTKRETGEDCCKVLDFGVAKMDASLTTTPGVIVGTVRYMAPEQLMSGAAVGPSADVYALGAILYECLAGHPAHAGETVQQVMFSVLNESREPLARIAPELPQKLLEAVDRALHKNPEQRVRSVDELAALLRGAAPRERDQRGDATLADDAVVQKPTGYPARTDRSRSLALLLGCAALAGVAGWAVGRRPPDNVARPSPRLPLAPSQPPSPPAAFATGSVQPTAGQPAAAPSASTATVPLKPLKPKPASSRVTTQDPAAPAGVEHLELSNPYGQ